MKKILLYLDPKNHMQRIGVFVAVFISILLIFLHNPIHGHTLMYDNSDNIKWEFKKRQECIDFDKLVGQWPRVSQQEIEQARKKIEFIGCYNDVLLPFNQWESNAPILEWLGPIVNLLWALCATWAAAIAWLILMRGTDDNSES